MRTPALVCIDDDDPMLGAYLKIDLPTSWTRRTAPRQPLAALYNDVRSEIGPCSWWGFLADDVVPETLGWDWRLVWIAGRTGMAVPAGGHDPDGAPHFVLGSDLVEDQGWLALPGLDRLFIDTVWLDIATERGALRRVPEVVLKHHHFSNGKALMDKTYRKTRKPEDRAIYDAWRTQKESP